MKRFVRLGATTFGGLALLMSSYACNRPAPEPVAPVVVAEPTQTAAEIAQEKYLAQVRQDKARIGDIEADHTYVLGDKGGLWKSAEEDLGRTLTWGEADELCVAHGYILDELPAEVIRWNSQEPVYRDGKQVNCNLVPPDQVVKSYFLLPEWRTLDEKLN